MSKLKGAKQASKYWRVKQCPYVVFPTAPSPTTVKMSQEVVGSHPTDTLDALHREPEEARAERVAGPAGGGLPATRSRQGAVERKERGSESGTAGRWAGVRHAPTLAGVPRQDSLCGQEWFLSVSHSSTQWQPRQKSPTRKSWPPKSCIIAVEVAAPLCSPVPTSPRMIHTSIPSSVGRCRLW